MSQLYLILFYYLSLGVPGVTSALAAADDLWPAQSFKSCNLSCPFINITGTGTASPGLLFLAPGNSTTFTQNPTIFDGGELVWQGQPTGNVSNFLPQTLGSQPVLTYWAGNESLAGSGVGSIHILNASYHEIHTVTLAGNETWVSPFPVQFPSYIDKHEILITEDGTILVTAYNATRMDLRPFNGPKDGWIQDSLFYEIDVASNEVLFRWSAVENLSTIDPKESVRKMHGTLEGSSQRTPWDYAHINSVARYGDDYLVSFKCLDTIYLINKDGSVQWKLNGRTGGDFELGQGTEFIAQHNARIQSRTDDIITISLHNNGVSCNETYVFPSNGLLLDVNIKTKKVTLNRKLMDSQDLVSASARGNYQALPDGYAMVGQGIVPKFEEYDEDNNCIARAWFGRSDSDGSYTAIKSNWIGTPQAGPDVFARSVGGMSTMYISWNGATGVESWEVSTGSKKDELKFATTVPKSGFETRIELEEVAAFVSVKAIGGPNHGRVSDPINVVRIEGKAKEGPVKTELKK
ncbi:hypothetical protein N7465_008543 [Penicillium sp. CMV-2018d]|nr:hypothetical protein N7465_008543 [Penicillium sp. CMV-2018d]